jgi:hypothetical protein
MAFILVLCSVLGIHLLLLWHFYYAGRQEKKTAGDRGRAPVHEDERNLLSKTGEIKKKK